MRPIKFRGRDLTGEMRFGHYVTDGGYPYIIEDHAWREVEPDSVAQFVGYDSDSNEVYEGDMFVIPCGTEIAARFINNLTPNAKLKEAHK